MSDQASQVCSLKRTDETSVSEAFKTADETSVSKASFRVLKRKANEPLKIILSKEDGDVAKKVARDEASKVAKIDNPSEPALPSDPNDQSDQDEAMTNPSPPQQKQSNVAPPQPSNVAPPQPYTFPIPSPPSITPTRVAPPQPSNVAPPQLYTFPIPPPPSITLTRSHPRPPFSQAGRDSDIRIVRHIIARQQALPVPRILNGPQLEHFGTTRLATLDPHKELIAYHLISHFLHRMQSCMSALQILLYGGHGDEQGFRRNRMTRVHFALAGRRLLENLAYLINTVHGLELSECPRPPI